MTSEQILREYITHFPQTDNDIAVFIQHLSEQTPQTISRLLQIQNQVNNNTLGHLIFERCQESTQIAFINLLLQLHVENIDIASILRQVNSHDVSAIDIIKQSDITSVINQLKILDSNHQASPHTQAMSSYSTSPQIIEHQTAAQYSSSAATNHSELSSAVENLLVHKKQIIRQLGWNGMTQTHINCYPRLFKNLNESKSSPVCLSQIINRDYDLFIYMATRLAHSPFTLNDFAIILDICIYLANHDPQKNSPVIFKSLIKRNSYSLDILKQVFQKKIKQNKQVAEKFIKLLSMIKPYCDLLNDRNAYSNTINIPWALLDSENYQLLIQYIEFGLVTKRELGILTWKKDTLLNTIETLPIEQRHRILSEIHNNNPQSQFNLIFRTSRGINSPDVTKGHLKKAEQAYDRVCREWEKRDELEITLLLPKRRSRPRRRKFILDIHKKKKSVWNQFIQHYSSPTQGSLTINLLTKNDVSDFLAHLSSLIQQKQLGSPQIDAFLFRSDVRGNFSLIHKIARFIPEAIPDLTTFLLTHLNELMFHDKSNPLTHTTYYNDTILSLLCIFHPEHPNIITYFEFLLSCLKEQVSVDMLFSFISNIDKKNGMHAGEYIVAKGNIETLSIYLNFLFELYTHGIELKKIQQLLSHKPEKTNSVIEHLRECYAFYQINPEVVVTLIPDLLDKVQHQLKQDIELSKKILDSLLDTKQKINSILCPSANYNSTTVISSQLITAILTHATASDGKTYITDLINQDNYDYLNTIFSNGVNIQPYTEELNKKLDTVNTKIAAETKKLQQLEFQQERLLQIDQSFSQEETYDKIVYQRDCLPEQETSPAYTSLFKSASSSSAASSSSQSNNLYPKFQ